MTTLNRLDENNSQRYKKKNNNKKQKQKRKCKKNYERKNKNRIIKTKLSVYFESPPSDFTEHMLSICLCKSCCDFWLIRCFRTPCKFLFIWTWRTTTPPCFVNLHVTSKVVFAVRITSAISSTKKKLISLSLDSNITEQLTPKKICKNSQTYF